MIVVMISQLFLMILLDISIILILVKEGTIPLLSLKRQKL